ncbi:hypothetical protein P8C59_007654 [Phyllachora maydis]|uniref:Uncharacterized protein n=1 Tax=Phyllachora maydis TaxID=1825666 RepID=A0AAD9MIL0_9PEZI|nr:hypothetical protein P8C59_007654 [Phyllachora maydis]
MRRSSPWPCALFLFPLAILASPASPPHAEGDLAATCSALASTLMLPHTTVWFSTPVAAGTNLGFPDNDPSCARPSQVDSEVARRLVQSR